MIYDTIDLNPDPGAPSSGDVDLLAEVTAGTAIANVTCGSIPNVTITQLESDNVTRLQVDAEYSRYRFAFTSYLPHFTGETPVQGIGGGDRVWSLNNQIFTAGLQYASAWDTKSLSLSTNSSELDPEYLPKVSFCLRRISIQAQTLAQGRSVVFLTVMNITDEEGQSISMVEGNASIPLQLVGCTLGWIKGTIALDANTGQPINTGPLQPAYSVTTSSSTVVWEPELFSADNWSGYSTDPEIDSWASMLSAAGAITQWPANLGNDTWQPQLTSAVGTISSQYIAQMLSLYTTVTLPLFENTLSQMTAAAYWAALHVVDPELQNGVLSMNTSELQGSKSMSQLSMNVAQISIGLGASFLMFIIAASSSLKHIESTPLIESFDPLRLIWLVVTSQGVRERMEEVEVPSTEHLRQAGMVPLNPESMSIHVAPTPSNRDYHKVEQDVMDDHEYKF